MNDTTTPRNPSDWKDKYLEVLDQHEKQQRQQHQLTTLLVKALVRISMISEGVDQQLDSQMAGLRQILRDGTPSCDDLNTIINALEGHVKRLDMIKDERSEAIQHAFQSLISHLQLLKPDGAAKRQLLNLKKGLKNRSHRIQEYSPLINEYAKVQRDVLDERSITRVSKPFWHQWTETEDAPIAAEKIADHSLSAPNDNFTELDLPSVNNEPLSEADLQSDEQEPPFSRLNKAVCDILDELLNQIDPPPMASDNYYAAKQQIAKGLNWYELVPTLEDISIVMVSAFDHNQEEFETFLTQLNERLLQAYQFINSSEQSNNAEREVSRQLGASMREQVSAIQSSVSSATELNQLKSEISSRLDQIMEVMDQQHSGEQQRESILSEQLDSLVSQIKNMEKDSALAEQRIDEQRQKALRDILTQLPNREAYQIRLEQEFERWQRYQRPLTMAICDIDHFKRVNDTYGHLAGDKVLRIIAKTLSTRLRKTDFIARFGGEEFILLLPETTAEQALTVVEGVREAIATCPFHFKEQPVSLTVSFGVAAFSEGDQAEQVFARADKALYGAKEQGRNQCILADTSDSSSNNLTA
ncbi:MAG: diguanylate cyclase [Oceanicoccus sp.]